VSRVAAQAELPTTELKPELSYELPSTIWVDSGIDDPVNDTGLPPHFGDFEVYNGEFGCLLRVILGESGESS
jgi:hypothetical protein